MPGLPFKPRANRQPSSEWGRLRPIQAPTSADNPAGYLAYAPRRIDPATSGLWPSARWSSGCWGPRLDRAEGEARSGGSDGAPRSMSAARTTCRSITLRPSVSRRPSRQAPGGHGHGRHPGRVAGARRSSPLVLASRGSMGLRGGLRARCWTSRSGTPFKPERERYLVHMTTGTHVAQICWFLLTESRYLPAQLLQCLAAGSGRNASVGGHTIIDLDLSKYDRLAPAVPPGDGGGRFVSQVGDRNAQPSLQPADRTHRARRGGLPGPILLTGPTGAGKSHLARKIYELKRSRRQVDGAFVEINCATLRGDAAMSTLFGHRKGAFTGAAADRPGLLRSADGGLLFLDEIGELGLDEQAMLLRALEEKRFLPLGADVEVTSDFLLIAGTNRDLEAAVVEGRFREDLLARINLWTFRLPGLAERPEDIEPNLSYELERFSSTNGQRTSFNKEASASFSALPRSGRPVAQELPRLQRRRRSYGDPRPRWAHRRRHGDGGNRATRGWVAERIRRRAPTASWFDISARTQRRRSTASTRFNSRKCSGSPNEAHR